MAFTTSPFFSGVKNYLEYVPFILVTLLFVAEAELGNLLISKTYHIVFMFLVITIMYLLLVILEVKKPTAIAICILLWIILIYIKRCKLD